MRWFVEVSRVGENSSDEKYCVEAKQWQAALQEARRLRGESGPLSKFSIELLDDGYRAVDPKQKLRYVVAKAPKDAVLSEGAADAASSLESGRNGRPSAAPSPSGAPPAATSLPSTAPSAVTTPSVSPPNTVEPLLAAPSAAAPAPAVTAQAATPMRVEAAATAPVASAAGFVAAEPYAGIPSSALSPHAPQSPPAVAVPAPPAVVSAKTPSAVPPRPLAPREQSAKPPAGITVPVDAIPPAPAVPRGLGPAVPAQNLTQPSAAIDMPPPSSVLRKRQEEPTPESPITYREVAYVVQPGVTRGAVEALLWGSFRDISRELAQRPGQKFVQLAVFDHKFERRPERPPLGTLAWKDWRGNPVLSFPFFDGSAHQRPSGAPPSIIPVAVVSIGGPGSKPPSRGSQPPQSATRPTQGAPSAAAGVGTAAASAISPVAAVAAPPVAPAAPAMPSPVPAAPSAAASPAAVAAAPVVAPAAVAAPATSEASAALPTNAPAVASAAAPDPIPLTREKLPSNPSSPRASRPRMAAVRRRAGEDLIGELFETMHDLHFMSGVADGAEFVLAAVDSVLPCEAVLIQVFDINARQFVVVRAKGPASGQALLHRTPDSEPFLASIMRRPGSLAIHDVHKDGRVLGARWEALGMRPARVLCGPVRQGGRYLGLVEVANPLGDAPFHQTEQNALDYVCEQFAEFLVNRPIVLDADVILRR